VTRRFPLANQPIFYDEVTYAYADRLGSPSLLRDQDGELSRQSFDAWGRQRSASDWGTPVAEDDTGDRYNVGFTGHEADLHGGLINMKFRMYDPRVGMFMAPDTIVPDPSRLQSWNRYAYVSNNPLNLVDPTGHQEVAAPTWCNVVAEGQSMGTYYCAVTSPNDEIAKWVDTSDPNGVYVKKKPPPSPPPAARESAYGRAMEVRATLFKLSALDRAFEVSGGTSFWYGGVGFNAKATSDTIIDGAVETARAVHDVANLRYHERTGTYHVPSGNNVAAQLLIVTLGIVTLGQAARTWSLARKAGAATKTAAVAPGAAAAPVRKYVHALIYRDRTMVVVNGKMYYRSATGQSGKLRGTWYEFKGIDEKTGWVAKGSKAEMDAVNSINLPDNTVIGSVGIERRPRAVNDFLEAAGATPVRDVPWHEIPEAVRAFFGR
jgi:RHS repeat-associated protein